MKKFPIAIIVAACMVMSACSNPEEEAKKLGFSNAAEMKDIQGKGFKTMAEYELDQKKQIEKRKADALKFAIDSIEGDIKSATTVEAVSALRNFKSRFDVFKDPANKDALEKLNTRLQDKFVYVGGIGNVFGGNVGMSGNVSGRLFGRSECEAKIEATYGPPAVNKYGVASSAKFIVQFLQGPMERPKYGINKIYTFNVYPDFYASRSNFDVVCVVAADGSRILGLD